MLNHHVLTYIRYTHLQAKVKKRWTELSRTRRKLIRELEDALYAERQTS